MQRTASLLAVAGFCFAAIGTTEAKTPGHEYCFNGVCHRVKSLEDTQRLVGVTTTLKASYYDDSGSDRFNPSNLTSSGEYFHAGRPDNAASPIYPDGTKLLVWHPASRKALVIRVNNAGPYWGDRKLDLSRAAAQVLGITGRGVATVNVRVLEAPSRADATYRQGRSYPPVKGYLGQFASLDAALAGLPGSSAPVTHFAAAPAAPKPEPAPVTLAAAMARPAAPLTQPPSAPIAPVTRKLTYVASLLDLNIARTAEAEARKYLVAQRMPTDLSLL